MAVQGVNGLAVAAAAAGVLLAWSGFKGAKVTTSLRSLLAGQQPVVPATPPNAILTPGALPSAAGSLGLGSPAQASANISSRSSGTGLAAGAIASLWVLAGGDPGKASVAVCIAQHESSGHTAVTSSNPDGGTNVGLWQLDTPGGKGAGYSVAQLQNPLTNARVAVKGSSNGTDWSAWATAGMCGV